MLNSHWDDAPAEYDALRQSWLNERRDLRVLQFLTGARAGSRVLEIGCGTGSSLIKIALARPDLQFIGVEPLESYCRYAEENRIKSGAQNVSFVCSFAEKLQTLIEEASIEWVISTDVLHHVEDTQAVLAALTSRSKIKARWLSIEPSWLNPYIFLFQACTRGERNFFPAPFLIAARRSGWELIERSYMTVIPSFIKNPPSALKTIERIVEGFPVVSGRVVLTLEHLGVKEEQPLKELAAAVDLPVSSGA